ETYGTSNTNETNIATYEHRAIDARLTRSCQCLRRTISTPVAWTAGKADGLQWARPLHLSALRNSYIWLRCRPWTWASSRQLGIGALNGHRLLYIRPGIIICMCC